jgi:hypothetical protein
MEVSVTMNGTTLWAREMLGTSPSTFTGDACQSDEMRRRIIAALTEALFQAQGSLGCLEIVDAVVDVGSAAAKIDRYVPVAVMRHSDSGRKVTEKSAVVSVLSTGSESLKVGIIRKPHIALVAALDDDDVSGI